MFGIWALEDLAPRILIRLTDHSAIRARDPPLHHRLDPFYPQPTQSAYILGTNITVQAKSQLQPLLFMPSACYPLLHHKDPRLKHMRSHQDPCDLPSSPYNPRPTCDIWFLHGESLTKQDPAVTTCQAEFISSRFKMQVGGSVIDGAYHPVQLTQISDLGRKEQPRAT